jgi:hypothetical protein
MASSFRFLAQLDGGNACARSWRFTALRERRMPVLDRAAGALGGTAAPLRTLRNQEIGMPGKHQMPSTLKRSPPKAQRTYEETLDHAEQEYGKGERASRTAYASLKHSFEKVGDHWEPKGHKGPSDPRSTKHGQAARRGEGASYGGVDFYGHSKQELYDRAKKLGVPGRSKMNKAQLAQAIAKKQK